MARELEPGEILGQPARLFTIDDGEWFAIYTNTDVDDPVLACGPRVAWVLEDDENPWIVAASPDNQQLAVELLSTVTLDQQP